MDKDQVQIKKNEYGFYEIKNKPSNDELSEYYANKYYQSEQGNYQNSYTDEELKFFQNKDTEKKIVLETITGCSKGDFLDIGCGEGFTLKHFEAFGWNVKGLDFSSFGCEKQNPDQVKNLISGDLYESLKRFIREGKTFDVVWMNNLLEHVIDPLSLLNDCKNLIRNKGVLVIQVPNDFSYYQKFLQKHDYIDHDFWVAYPDHLNYFTRESLQNFCESNGWNEAYVLSDFPIDIFLSNEHSNYIKDRTKGKAAHQSRVQLDNLFHENSPNKTIKLYNAMAELGMGRQIISFFQKE